MHLFDWLRDGFLRNGARYRHVDKRAPARWCGRSSATRAARTILAAALTVPTRMPATSSATIQRTGWWPRTNVKRLRRRPSGALRSIKPAANAQAVQPKIECHGGGNLEGRQA